MQVTNLVKHFDWLNDAITSEDEAMLEGINAAEHLILDVVEQTAFQNVRN